MFPTEPVPEQIGAYKVIRRLGGSGSADMYLGRMDGPMGFQRGCALKLVPNTLEDDPRLAEELAREASICARLNHPAIVRMFDFFEHERRLVLVLEHVDGADLDRLLQNLARRRQRLGDEAIWYLGREIVGALAHAHAATDESGNQTPVIHRNLQPENVLVSWEGQVRLTGFGLGKILGRTPDTVVGTIKGTPGYMAPEQARGERVTPRADVYGVGVLLWSLLTGRRPPSDGTRPESISKVRTDIPREIAAAIDAALEPSPDKRKITCTEIEQWLAKLANIDAGRAELREKILILRGARTAEPGATETSRPRPAPRRRVSLGRVRASQRPPGPGPLSVPPPPSTRTAQLRTSERPGGGSTRPAPSQAPSAALAAPGWRGPSIDMDAIDELLDEPPALPPGARAPIETRPESPIGKAPTAKRPVQKTLLGGLTGAISGTSPGWRAPTETTKPPALPTPAEATSALELPPEPPRSARPPPELDPQPAPGLGEWRDVGEERAGPAGAAPSGADPEAAVAPRRQEGKRVARPLSAIESIGVASVTAALVVGIGILLADRNPPAPAPPPVIPSNQVTTQAQQPTPTEPTTSPVGTQTVAPTTPAASGTAGLDLPGGFGLLTVVTPVNAQVFVNGLLAGPANQPVRAICGRRFVRLGTVMEGGRFPAWVAPGQTVIIPCQASVTVEIRPSPSPQ